MKIRIGFVSNSSSASFLMATKKEISLPFLRMKLRPYLKSMLRNISIKDIHKAAEVIYNGIDWDYLGEIESGYMENTDLPFFNKINDEEFTFLYPGGVDSFYHWLFGIEIDREDFKLFIDTGY